MGHLENPTNRREKQAAPPRRRRPGGAARARRCLLKGCERRYRPRQARQRYCCGECRKAARAWSRWKAQRRYRGTTAGKQKRNGQSRRRRERVKTRKPPIDEAAPDAARVITTACGKVFFRRQLRPARLLRMFRASAAVAATTLLFAAMPPRNGTRLGARPALPAHARRLSAAAIPAIR